MFCYFGITWNILRMILDLKNKLLNMENFVLIFFIDAHFTVMKNWDREIYCLCYLYCNISILMTENLENTEINIVLPFRICISFPTKNINLPWLYLLKNVMMYLFLVEQIRTLRLWFSTALNFFIIYICEEWVQSRCKMYQYSVIFFIHFICSRWGSHGSWFSFNLTWQFVLSIVCR